MTQREGALDIGLSYYQEEQWLTAIRKYGESILTKSLLSQEQKNTLIKESLRREVYTNSIRVKPVP